MQTLLSLRDPDAWTASRLPAERMTVRTSRAAPVSERAAHVSQRPLARDRRPISDFILIGGRFLTVAALCVENRMRSLLSLRDPDA
jgi:hypothetical protein